MESYKPHVQERTFLTVGTMKDGAYFFKIRASDDKTSFNGKGFFEDEFLEIFTRQVPIGLKYVYIARVFDGPIRNSHEVQPQMISVLRKRGMEKLFDMNTCTLYS